MPVNTDGNGPETDPAKVASAVCMDHGWEPWPCRYDGSGWSFECQTGEHEDGRSWQAWHVHLHGEPVFWSPSLELAQEGIEDYIRSGHGPRQLGECTHCASPCSEDAGVCLCPDGCEFMAASGDSAASDQ